MSENPILRLAHAMQAAEAEKRAFNGGRFAFRDKGEIAMNPNPPGSADHKLWADGFAYERGRRPAPRRGNG
jgi:hypothetical protein